MTTGQSSERRVEEARRQVDHLQETLAAAQRRLELILHTARSTWADPKDLLQQIAGEAEHFLYTSGFLNGAACSQPDVSEQGHAALMAALRRGELL